MSISVNAVPALPPGRKPRRGRRSTMPATELGLFIQQRLDDMNMTRAELAKRLHVSPSTIGRLLNGDTRVVQRVSTEDICSALALNDMDRRAFLKLIGTATTASFAFPTGTNTPKYKIDLDLANGHADALSRLIDRGETKYVYESAQRWYNTLIREQPYAKDEHFGAIQLRFGILLGAAQEFTFPWYQRSMAAIQTYDRIEEQVILRYGLNTFPQEYANLLSHRAPLYRETGQYDESARQFEDAIYWVQRVDDPRLRATLFRSRIYISAVQGDERQWSRELEKARRDLRYLPAYYEQSAGLLDYAEGEGYKQFAFNPHKQLSLHARQAYASRALHCFEQSRSATLDLPPSHHLLVAVSEAQCLIWIDPEETIRRLECIWHEVEIFNPAMLDKMRRTMEFARLRLQVRQRDPLPVFDLHAKRK